MNILITGARAPVAVEWATRLKRHGRHTIFMADSPRLPLGRWARATDRYIKVCPPRHDPHAYVRDIARICTSEAITLIIPTCEEIFYLAALREELPPTVTLFADTITKLRQFHDKARFIEILTGMGVTAPQTTVIPSRTALQTWLTTHNHADYIIKPPFCRFGAEVILEITSRRLPRRYPVLIQQKIRGEERCAYGIAVAGQLVAYACYHPKYRAGPGAGIYFSPRTDAQIWEFTREFVRTHNFTGQIAFDFICPAQGGVYPIECNPRGTSGLHLLPGELDLLKMIQNPQVLSEPQPATACQLKLPMWLYLPNNLGHYPFKELWRDYGLAQDVYTKNGETGLAYWQIVSFLELLGKSLAYGGSIRRAATEDIQYDGNELVVPQ